MKKYLSLFILTTSLIAVLQNGHLNAQCNTAPCSTPTPSTNAQDACILPNPAALDCYFGATTASIPVSFPPAWCTTIENNHFFAFTADAPAIDFQICTYNCSSGSGVQAAILSTVDCINFAFESNCLGNVPSGTCQTLISANLIPGEVYYLMIDGNAGSICDYSINGSTSAINGATQGLCLPNASVTYNTSTVSSWSIIPPSAGSFQGDSIGNTVVITWTEYGPAQVCAQSQFCQNAPNQCLDVFVGQKVEYTDTLELCQNQAVECAGKTFTMGGNFTVILPGSTGCDSVVHCLIHILPSPVVDLGTKFICPGSCFQMGDSLYCKEGFYTHVFNTAYGCDSLVNFNLVEIPINTAATIEAPSGLTVTCLHPELLLLSQPPPFVSNLWTNFGGDTLGTGKSILVKEQGFYFHTVKSTIPGTNCIAQDKIFIKQNTLPPPVTASGGIIDAMHPTVQLIGKSIISGLIYHWTGPNGFMSNLKKPIVSVPGIYTLTVTNPQTGCSNSVMVEVIMMN